MVLQWFTCAYVWECKFTILVFAAELKTVPHSRTKLAASSSKRIRRARIFAPILGTWFTTQGSSEG
eukprot:3452256-Amphidinium_carterae.1